ncbi:hypothetical protein [uncultured Methylobacterium sp.]|uniref:hypothetical protein n=1 Tax=uncultured Methylobacterium sp. TaxID=157278 RepID=UPI0035CAE583
MPIPYGYTRGAPGERVAWLKEAIEAIEDGLATAAQTISYPNAGDLATLSRVDAEMRLRQLYVQYAKLTGDDDLLRQVQNNPRFIRMVGTFGYSRPGAAGGWGYVP